MAVITDFYTKYPGYRNIPFIYHLWFLTDSKFKTADQLYERYTDFGKDPFVVALEGAPKVKFSAWTYAQQRAKDFTAQVQKVRSSARACVIASGYRLSADPADCQHRNFVKNQCEAHRMGSSHERTGASRP